MPATLTLKITGISKAPDGTTTVAKDTEGWLINYGVTDSLGPLPLNSI